MKPEGKRILRNLEVGERIILKWILKKKDGVIWTGLIWLRERSCEHGNEP
jgi:hypothetical protein